MNDTLILYCEKCGKKYRLHLLDVNPDWKDSYCSKKCADQGELEAEEAEDRFAFEETFNEIIEAKEVCRDIINRTRSAGVAIDGRAVDLCADNTAYDLTVINEALRALERSGFDVRT